MKYFSSLIFSPKENSLPSRGTLLVLFAMASSEDLKAMDYFIAYTSRKATPMDKLKFSEMFVMGDRENVMEQARASEPRISQLCKEERRQSHSSATALDAKEKETSVKYPH